MKNTNESRMNQAENERAEMIEPFVAWVENRLQDSRRSVRSLRRHLAEVAPFASAAVDGLADAEPVPAVIVEYAATSLQLADAEREVARCEVAADVLTVNETVLSHTTAPETLWLWEEYRQGLAAYA
jgi:hypothetical protein